MDRKTWLVVGLCVVAFVLWEWYYNTNYAPYFREQAIQQAKQAAAQAAAAKAASTPVAPVPASTPVAGSPVPEANVPTMTAQDETLASQGKKDESRFLFNNDAGGIAAVQLLGHLDVNNTAISLNSDRRMPIGALSTTPGQALGGFAMNTDRAHGTVTFSKSDSDGLVIQKKFTVPPNDSPESPYVVNLEVTFTNPSAIALSRPGYFLNTGAAAPVHPKDMTTYTRFDWSAGNKMSGHDVNAFSASAIPFVGIQLHAAQDTISQSVADVDWTAVTSQYFCTIVSAQGATKGQSVWCSRFVVPGSPEGAPSYGIQGAFGLGGFTLAPGKTIIWNFQIYAGPKEIGRLDQLGGNQEAVLNFGYFGFISKILLRAMNGLRDLLGNYAAAIIVLTLIIKTVLWPLQNKATNSMRRMSVLSPKMTELREKYKDDPTKMNEELMKLYRDYGVNPLSGCLPMLIQIPIFFGFYGMLGTAIQLRNSHFWWIHDLSQPDTIATVLGYHINLLPLFMAGTMLWQMTLTPKTGDATQQRMMMFMPVIFIVFAYNYASALSLYWTTNNLFSIVQLYLTRNRPMPTLEKLKVKRPSAGNSLTRKKRPS